MELVEITEKCTKQTKPNVFASSTVTKTARSGKFPKSFFGRSSEEHEVLRKEDRRTSVKLERKPLRFLRGIFSKSKSSESFDLTESSKKAVNQFGNELEKGLVDISKKYNIGFKKPVIVGGGGGENEIGRSLVYKLNTGSTYKLTNSVGDRVYLVVYFLRVAFFIFVFDFLVVVFYL